jgi:hypothetical protein
MWRPVATKARDENLQRIIACPFSKCVALRPESAQRFHRFSKLLRVHRVIIGTRERRGDPCRPFRPASFGQASDDPFRCDGDAG